jgi:hypothetical protein
MANESDILCICTGTYGGKKATGRAALVNEAGLQVVFYGASTTRAAVLAECGASAAIGAVYLSSAGKQYIKVANAAAATDWQRVTATAAD